jgi:UDP-2,3-diacylglucosamine pyrophosphatase LpxH
VYNLGVNTNRYDTLIISDLHLGSDISRAADAVRMLREKNFSRLILLGDIFSDLNLRRLTKEHWKFLGYIRKLSNPKRGIEVVWVEGNHDQGLSTVMSHLVGVKVYQEYTWQFAGRKHMAVHGHQFDRFVVNNLLLSHLNSFLHLQLQKLAFPGKGFSRFLDRMNTSWLRLSSKVANGALHHAKSRNAHRIFCGHTHEALYREFEGIEYYNSGSWTDVRPTFVTVGSDGVRIHEYRDAGKPLENSDSYQEQGYAEPAFAEFADEAGLLEDAEYETVGR